MSELRAHPRTASEPPTALASELTDLLQLSTQTLLHITTPSLLDPTKEHLSSSFISVPTATISSLLTVTKILNYVVNQPLRLDNSVRDRDPHEYDSFDVNELLQAVGDVLGATAAQSGIDIILSYSDITSRHVSVSGQNVALLHALSHILQRLIAVASVGDSIEVGLSTKSSKDDAASFSFEISHRSVATPTLPDLHHTVFQSSLLSLGASLLVLPMRSATTSCRKYQLSVPLKPADQLSYSTSFALRDASVAPSVRLASEPSLAVLGLFTETLKGKRVELHANSSPFAQCLTTYLTAWGMEIARITTDREEHSGDANLSETHSSGSASAQSAESPSFVIIDDDIDELRRRTALSRRSSSHAFFSKRPVLIHRPKSLHRGSDASVQDPNHIPVIIYFTSLSKYPVITALLQSLEVQHLQSSVAIPEVVALPKPVGPRRFLMALFSAVNKAVPDFPAMATSPTTPPAHSNQFLDAPSVKSRTSPDTRARVEKPMSRSPREMGGTLPHQPYPGSPLAMEVDTQEYFPATDIHALGQTPSSGMLIQSPDGQPAGIFFKPPTSKAAKQTYTSNPPPATKASERDAMSRTVGNSIETIRNSTRHFSDDSVPKTLSHPISFRSKTTTAVPGTGVYSSNSPSVPEYVQRRRPSANAVGETNIIRADVSQEDPTPRPADEQEHSETGRVPHKGVLSPPRGRSSIDGQKTATPSSSKLSENTIVPPINVLIVEDNPINQAILTTFMKRKKINYDTAKDGQEAIDKYKSGNFHLILMDIQMPVMDGIEATREIRRLETDSSGTSGVQGSGTSILGLPRSLENGLFRSSVIIVALTASSLQSDRVNALAAGCNDFLTKPVSLVWLNNKIIEWGSLKALQMYASTSPVSSPINREVGESGAKDKPSSPRSEYSSTDYKRPQNLHDPTLALRAPASLRDAVSPVHSSSDPARLRRRSNGSSSSESASSGA